MINIQSKIYEKINYLILHYIYSISNIKYESVLVSLFKMIHLKSFELIHSTDVFVTEVKKTLLKNFHVVYFYN